MSDANKQVGDLVYQVIQNVISVLLVATLTLYCFLLTETLVREPTVIGLPAVDKRITPPPVKCCIGYCQCTWGTWAYVLGKAAKNYVYVTQAIKTADAQRSSNKHDEGK